MKGKRALLREVAIELAIYGVLVVIYFLLALRFLSEPLETLFENSLVIYAFAGLGLIVGQGVLLDAVTSFLLNRLGLGRSE